MKETSLEPGSTIKPLNAAGARSVHPGIRALNFIVDMSIWFVLAFISVILLDHLLPTLNHFTINAIAYSVMAALFLAYHTIFEYYFQKTAGKFITGTKVVSTSGSRPSFALICRRSLFRFIPIDWASYFFKREGMHDFLSGTKVIRDRDE
jgi:uncharacterized RDD family membrane protein YckC